MEALTDKQTELLDYLTSYKEQHGWYPSLSEAAKGLNVTNNAINDRLQGLIRKGWVERTMGVARGIKVL